MVRKDLVRQFRGQFPVPTYVVEFMLGRERRAVLRGRRTPPHDARRPNWALGP